MLEKAARTSSGSRRYAGDIAGSKIQRVDLVKRILLLPFALEDQLLAIRREVALAAPLSLKDELSGVRKKRVLRRILGRRKKRRRCTKGEKNATWRAKVEVTPDYCKSPRFLTLSRVSNY
jgi:hypothetical protein